MEPLSDRELDKVLGQWGAPPAPETLTHRIYRARRWVRWKWLLNGSIRVPVPLTFLVAAAFVALCVLALSHSPREAATRQEVTSGFQPVKRLEVRIIRSSYENGK